MGESSVCRKELYKLVDVLLACEPDSVSWNKEVILQTISMCKTILAEQESCVRLRAPLKIVGDIHGQFKDLKRLLHANGYPPKTQYLFLGDYVDRGSRSLHVIMLLLTYKCLYPDRIALLRGNHEVWYTNKVYGFYDELHRRGMPELFPEFNSLFDWLPLTALIDKRILCMHGGISQHLESIEQLRDMPRPITMLGPPEPLLALDLIWADPARFGTGYAPNMSRGVSHTFGLDALEQLCHHLNIDMIVRAHQVVERGFDRMGMHDKTRLVTVFSAPNYCNEFDNCAAVMCLDEKMCVRFNVLEPSYASPNSKIVRSKTPKMDVFPRTFARASQSIKKNVTSWKK